MPKIKRDDATTIIDGELGNRAEIECLVEGHPQPAITWLKNNSPLDLSDNSFQYYTTHNHQRLNFIDLKVILCFEKFITLHLFIKLFVQKL